MHWLIPFAGALSPAAAEAASALRLPHLEQLLARLAPTLRDEAEPFTLSPPHERALARAWGWPTLPDGLLPLAARQARADGLNVADDGRGWGLLTPTHWHLGTEQVSLGNPAELALDEASSRQFYQAVQPLFDDEGMALHWGAPQRWYLVHERLASLPTASLDRVVGRNVDLWLNTHPEARRFRRLQAEAQMLLHTHALNQARETQGLLPVNSFWLSGTGRPLDIGTGVNDSPARAPQAVHIDERLRAPALAEDWAAWAEAFHALDAGPLREALAACETGQPVALTLCGERTALHLHHQPRSWRQRWFGARRQPAAPLLQGL